MSALLGLVSWACILAGGALVVIGAVGLLRLPDVFTRMHGASLVDTLGAALILAGLAFQAGIGLVSLKLGLILVFILLTGPAATHALAKAALHGGLTPRLAPGERRGPP